MLETALEEFLRKIIREEIHSALQLMHIHRNETTDKDYLAVTEAAGVSGLAVSTIRLLIRRRTLTALKVGRRVLIKRADLQAFLDRQRICVA